MQTEYPHAESALYWSAISMVVCEGLSIAKAAKRLGVAEHELREVLKRRTEPPFPLADQRRPKTSAPLPPQIVHSYPATRPITRPISMS